MEMRSDEIRSGITARNPQLRFFARFNDIQENYESFSFPSGPRGPPPHPRVLLFGGRWKDGKTFGPHTSSTYVLMFGLSVGAKEPRNEAKFSPEEVRLWKKVVQVRADRKQKRTESVRKTHETADLLFEKFLSDFVCREQNLLRVKEYRENLLVETVSVENLALIH